MAKRPAIEVPDDLLRQSYVCKDCARETGGDGVQPGTAFNWARAPRYALGFRRQAYCRRHQSIRNGRAQKDRMQQPEAREKRRAWDRENWSRYRARRYADNRAYYARKRDERAQAYREWVEANPEKRKASQDAWRARRRLRGKPESVVWKPRSMRGREQDDG